MSETEKSLFGNINLNSGNFIEVPGMGEAPVQQAEETSNDEPKKQEKKKTEEQEVNDGSFEIPDIVVEIAKETQTTDEGKEDKSKGTPPNKGNSSSSPFKPFAKALYEEGVLTSFDEDEFDKLVEELGPAEALIEMNRRTLAGELEEYKAGAEAEYKAWLDARESGVDLDDWSVLQENKKTYASITDEKIDDDENLQKRLVQADLEKKGLDADTIKETIESFEDTGKLGKQAKTALKNLKKDADEAEKRLKLEAKTREENEVKQQNQQLETLKKQLKETKEFIPGLALNQQTKDELFTMITASVKQTDDGRQLNAVMAKRMEDPIKYALLEAYFVKLGLFDGKYDKLVTKAKTKAIEELTNKLSSESNTQFSANKDGLGRTDDEHLNEFEKAFGRI